MLRPASLRAAPVPATASPQKESAEPSHPTLTNRAPAPSGRFPLAPDALGLMLQVLGKLEEHVEDKDLVSIHTEDMILQAGLAALLQQSQHVPGEQREEFKRDVAALGQQVGQLHLAADLRHQDEAAAKLPAVRAAFQRITDYFPQPILLAARAAAERYSCPWHPGEQGRKSDFCAKCGQPLEQEIRLLPEFCGFALGSGPSVSAEVRVERPLVVGEPAAAVLQLRRADGAPVYPSDLILSHTERIHLLLLDASQSDYHHEHPRYAGRPGEYAFSFTPGKPGPYQVWAEVRPQPVGLQEYALATIASVTKGEPVSRAAVTNRVTAGGLRWELDFPTNTLRIARPINGRLRLSYPDGRPCTDLEPVMDAFAHLVGFYEDGRSVLHIHPKGVPVLSPKVRGGPDLEFQFYTMRRGVIRLFAEVRLDGTPRYAPFGILIGP